MTTEPEGIAWPMLLHGLPIDAQEAARLRIRLARAHALLTAAVPILEWHVELVAMHMRPDPAMEEAVLASIERVHLWLEATGREGLLS